MGAALAKGDIVLVDHRKPTASSRHDGSALEIYEKSVLLRSSRHSVSDAYMFAESGDVNTIVHDWAYEDPSDRMRRRAHVGRSGMAGLYSKAQRIRLPARAEDLADDPAKFCPISADIKTRGNM